MATETTPYKSQVSVTHTNVDEVSLTSSLDIDLLIHSNILSDIYPTQTTTSHLDVSFSQGAFNPTQIFITETDTSSTTHGVTITDFFFTPGSIAPSQTATMVLMPSVMPRTTSHISADLESKSQGTTPTTDNTMGYLTMLGSATVISKSISSMSALSNSVGLTTEQMTEGTGGGKGGGKGILNNLGDAPLWVWVAVALVALTFISCCFILCIVAAWMTKKQAMHKIKQQGHQTRGVTRRRSSRMSQIYGEMEEGKQNEKKKKTTEKTTKEAETKSSTISRWDNLRMSWSRRSSRKAFSTFKPHLSSNKQVSSSSTNTSDTTSSSVSTRYTPESLGHVISNLQSQQYTISGNDHPQPPCISTGATAFRNPLFGMDTQNRVGKGHESTEPYPKCVLDTKS